MDILKVLLFPLAVVYDLITRFRNHLYTIGHKRSFRFQTMVIGVGNLSAGGSGKTPMVEYLLNLLKTDYKLATLSRGYGRKTTGFRFASNHDSASTLGDEPFQFQRKFGPDVTVTVGEERAEAIPKILHEHPDTDIIILDDAYQHRSVVPQLSILLTEYSAPFYRDFVLPMGRLRESRKEAKRADVVVVTKCPTQITEQQRAAVQRMINRYTRDKPIFFSGLIYDHPIPFRSGYVFSNDVILVSGIANAGLFEEYASASFNVIHHYEFRDHFSYTSQDLQHVIDHYNRLPLKPILLTTEKDMVRLIGLPPDQIIEALPWFYLPIQIQFLKNGPDFDKIVLRSVENSKTVS